METKTEFLKPDEVAKRLAVTARTLSSWRKQGIGPPWIQLGGRVRYAEADLAAWLESIRNASDK